MEEWNIIHYKKLKEDLGKKQILHLVISHHIYVKKETLGKNTEKSW